MGLPRLLSNRVLTRDMTVLHLHEDKVGSILTWQTKSVVENLKYFTYMVTSSLRAAQQCSYIDDYNFLHGKAKMIAHKPQISVVQSPTIANRITLTESSNTPKLAVIDPAKSVRRAVEVKTIFLFFVFFVS
jgi:hypothetical protein